MAQHRRLLKQAARPHALARGIRLDEGRFHEKHVTLIQAGSLAELNVSSEELLVDLDSKALARLAQDAVVRDCLVEFAAEEPAPGEI